MKNRIYIGYMWRLAIYLVSSVLLLAVMIAMIVTTLNTDETVLIKYSESNNASYRINLVENDYYDTDYLDESMKIDKYVAGLIKTIDVNFDYSFNVDEKSNVDFVYGIYGTLTIKDGDNKNTYKVDEITFVKDKNISMTDLKQQTIHEKVTIDYDNYNSIVNDYKNNNAIAVNSDLKVYMRIYKLSQDDNTKFNMEASEIAVDIPMAIKSIMLDKLYEPLVTGEHIKIQNLGKFTSKTITILVILGVALLFCLYKLAKLFIVGRGKKSEFDKTVDRLLREYDRLIVETSSAPNFNNCNVIKIKKFEELLDVRDNLKLPIMHYTVVKHLKAYFYIKNHKDVYLVTLKAVDLEN